jgi:Flp pilus assembly protein TadD
MEAFQRAVELTHRASVPLTGLGMAYAKMGKTQEAEKLLSQLNELSDKTYVSPFFLACLYASLDRKDDAFRLLDKAYEERSNGMSLLKVIPMVDPLRSDPRFTALLARLKLL